MSSADGRDAENGGTDVGKKTLLLERIQLRLGDCLGFFARLFGKNNIGDDFPK